MATTTDNVTDYDHATGQVVTREMTAEELATQPDGTDRPAIIDSGLGEHLPA